MEDKNSTYFILSSAAGEWSSLSCSGKIVTAALQICLFIELVSPMILT